MPVPAVPRPDILLLPQAELFKGLDSHTLAAIELAARRRRMADEGFFFHQDEPAIALYVLLAGRVKLSQLTPEAQQVILRVAGPGETFGAIAALDDERYPVTAQAAEGCLALAWDTATMLDLMDRFPQLAINAFRVMARRVREFQDRYRELASERVERRVARALLRLASQFGRKIDSGVLIDLTLSRQDLAAMTGTTLFSVSRIISAWEQRGIVESGRERLVIKQPHSLVVIAEDLPTATVAAGE